MRAIPAIVLAALLLVLAPPALALCSGASVERDYREADMVVRARVVATTTVAEDVPSAAFVAEWGEYNPVELHRIRVSEVFKGRPDPDIRIFQAVTSARFPLDLGGDYLLFLNRIRPYAGRPAAARGAMEVTYTCGQSKPWSQVRPEDLARVLALVQGR